MKVPVMLLFIGLVSFAARSQSIVGTWQLVNQTSCLDQELGEEDDELSSVVADMKSMSDGTSSVIRFKDNNSGDENIRMIESRRSSKKNNFLYKYADGNLYILDKKSRLLMGSYEVERLTADSLIFSNIRRACETRIFIRIEDK